MKSSALPEFWECFEQLPTKARRNARKNFLLWQKQPTLKSLGFKRIKHTGEVRIVGKGSWWPGADSRRTGASELVACLWF